ncbi:MAG: T9SS type A sorting domain-containing protein [Saprospiraceae bacterium]
MKCLILSIALILLYSGIHAQLEYSFENWSRENRPLPFLYETPDGWTTTNALTEFIRPGVLQTNDAHSGSKAVLIQSLDVFGSNVTSSITLGKAAVNFINRMIDYNGDGLKFDKQSVQLSFWYKYSSNFSNRYGLIKLYHYRYINNVRKLENLITDTLRHSNSYTYVKIKYDASSISSNDTLVVVFKSDDGQAENLNLGQLWVDDVVLEFLNNNLDIELSNNKIKIYPNPISNKGKLVVNNGVILGNKNYNLYDVSGRLATSGVLNDQGIIDFSELIIKSGIYVLSLGNELSKMNKIVFID